jgi:gluconolactonase
MAEAGHDGSVGAGDAGDSAPQVIDAGTDGGDGSSDLLGTATPIMQSDFVFQSLEGPYWVAGGVADAGADSGAPGYVIFSDVVEKNNPGCAIYKYDPGANAFSVYPYPMEPISTNGLGVDSQGRLIATERLNHQVTRVENGVRTALVSAWPGPDGGLMPLNAPNDLVQGSLGDIYFTDTHYGTSHPMSLLPTAAYRIAPSGAVSLVYSPGADPNLNSINGVALSPDGKTLYLGDDTANKLFSMPVNADGSVGADGGTTVTTLLTQDSVPGGNFRIPDGVNVDDNGDIYVALNDYNVDAVARFDKTGKYKGRYSVPVPLDVGLDASTQSGGKGPSNLTFGDADRKTLYITTLHGLYKVRVDTPGLP